LTTFPPWIRLFRQLPANRLLESALQSGSTEFRVKFQVGFSNLAGNNNNDDDDDFPFLLLHLPPGSGEGEVGLSLFLLEVATALTTLQQGNLQMR
jgi:hypothetical protein